MGFKSGDDWNGNADGRPKNEDSVRSCLRRFLDMSIDDFEDYTCKTNAEIMAYHRVLKARKDPEDGYKEQDSLINQVDGNPKNVNENTNTDTVELHAYMPEKEPDEPDGD